MKKLFVCLSFLFSYFISVAGEDNKVEVKSPVKSVILYLDGAEVTHNSQVTLNAGRNVVTFAGLTPKLISKSVQVNVPADVTILSVSDHMNYLSVQQQSGRIKQLQDSSAMLSDNLRLLQNDRDAFQLEKQMMISNQSIGGTTTGITVANLKPAADFFRARIQEINAEIYKIEKKEKAFNETLSKVTQQLSDLNAKFSTPTAEVVVLVNVTAKTSANFELKYIVRAAGWAPTYDLKAEDVDKPIELKYRANVYNNTGIDWSDVKLKLSTADPLASASQPEMSTWYLDYSSPGHLYKISGTSNNNAGYASPSQNNYESVLEEDLRSKGISSGDVFQYSNKDLNGLLISTPGVTQKATKRENIVYDEIQVSELSAEFDIKVPYSIPSDAKVYLVDVTNYTLPATYLHFCAPKIDKDAFLLARITGWEDLDLVEGTANVYYGGSYVGKSYINTRSTDDTLNLSLGRDRKVMVTREKQKDLTSVKYIGTNKRESYVFEITVKNNRKTPIHMEVVDQLPISKQGDITVEVSEITNAEQDLVTGKLSWKFTLAPDENKKINLAYILKYPKNKTISKQKTQSRINPRFLR